MFEEIVVEYQNYSFDIASGVPCPDEPFVTVIDGNVYNAVLIGFQCWMKENLKTTTYNNGTAIPNVMNASSWSYSLTGGYVCYDNIISWKNNCGALYNRYVTIDPNGLCPTGWHVPTNDEWMVLTNCIGGTGSTLGNELKSCRQANSPYGRGCNISEYPRWKQDTFYGSHGTDDYDFSGLPGGIRAVDEFAPFLFIGNVGFWWSSTMYTSNYSWYRSLGYFYDHMRVNYFDKHFGFSIRCLRD